MNAPKTPMRRMPYVNRDGASNDGCEWNPAEDRPSRIRDPHYQMERATLLVGCRDPWRLCQACAELKKFKLVRVRKKIIQTGPTARSSSDKDDPMPEDKACPYKVMSIEMMKVRVTVIRRSLYNYSVLVYHEGSATNTYPAATWAKARMVAWELADFHKQIV